MNSKEEEKEINTAFSNTNATDLSSAPVQRNIKFGSLFANRVAEQRDMFNNKKEGEKKKPWDNRRPLVSDPLIKESIDAFFKGKKEEALDMLDQGIKSNPKNAEAYFAEGFIWSYCFCCGGSRPKAIESYDAAIKANPGFIEAYERKGNVLLSSRRFAEALECFEQGLELNSKHTLLYFRKMLALGHIERKAEVRELYKKAKIGEVELDGDITEYIVYHGGQWIFDPGTPEAKEIASIKFNLLSSLSCSSPISLSPVPSQVEKTTGSGLDEENASKIELSGEVATQEAE